MPPEDPNEIRSKLEQGRINMAAKLGEVCGWGVPILSSKSDDLQLYMYILCSYL